MKSQDSQRISMSSRNYRLQNFLPDLLLECGKARHLMQAQAKFVLVQFVCLSRSGLLQPGATQLISRIFIKTFADDHRIVSPLLNMGWTFFGHIKGGKNRTM